MGKEKKEKKKILFTHFQTSLPLHACQFLSAREEKREKYHLSFFSVLMESEYFPHFRDFWKGRKGKREGDTLSAETQMGHA